MKQPPTDPRARQFHVLARTIAVLAVFALAEPLAASDQRPPQVVRSDDMNAAVSLAIEVTEDGAIEGTMRNNTTRKIGDVEVLVEYAWIWAKNSGVPDATPGWSTTYTLPVELTPGESVPMNLAPLHPLPDRDDGHFLISAKVVGYTRFRWVTPDDPN
jgi:hypothetical protein